MSSDNRQSPRYEVDSLRGRPIVIFVAGFILMLAICFWIAEKTLRHLDATTPAPVPPSQVVQRRLAPDAPLLQPTQQVDRSAAADLEAMKSHEDEIFARLGWAVDHSTHQAIIPDQLISRMMQQKEDRR